mmetsp:Transcript_5031/g.14053  ORF Transcript_5031/g.14053 Transcript_5031/m.14053 type:complete len:408 (-) Transcript_5031:498-1721(-)
MAPGAFSPWPCLPLLAWTTPTSRPSAARQPPPAEADLWTFAKWPLPLCARVPFSRLPDARPQQPRALSAVAPPFVHRPPGVFAPPPLPFDGAPAPPPSVASRPPVAPGAAARAPRPGDVCGQLPPRNAAFAQLPPTPVVLPLASLFASSPHPSPPPAPSRAALSPPPSSAPPPATLPLFSSSRLPQTASSPLATDTPPPFVVSPPHLRCVSFRLLPPPPASVPSRLLVPSVSRPRAPLPPSSPARLPGPSVGSRALPVPLAASQALLSGSFPLRGHAFASVPPPLPPCAFSPQALRLAADAPFPLPGMRAPRPPPPPGVSVPPPLLPHGPGLPQLPRPPLPGAGCVRRLRALSAPDPPLRPEPIFRRTLRNCLRDRPLGTSPNNNAGSYVCLGAPPRPCLVRASCPQ